MIDSVSNIIKPITKPDIIIFIAQVVLLFVVVITSLVNLSIDNGNTNLWTMVLTSCLGYMMPNPRFKGPEQSKDDDEILHVGRDGVVLRDLAVEHNQQPEQHNK